ncbi:MAG: hypothetical protein M3162_00350 [Thermoproteota archaeon]|nr:hypothetical protein [Thermoproteota archaeon]
MTRKTTGTSMFLFVVFVLSSAIFTASGTVFGQQPQPNLQNNTAASTNTTDSTLEPHDADETNATHGHPENATSSAAEKETVVRDSQTVLLEGTTLPEGSFIHLYDTTPFKITNGHVALKVPCNDANSTSVQVLVGQAPVLNAAELEFVSPLSQPGDLCLYHADLESNSTNIITDIALRNNGTDNIEFPATSTVVIGVGKVAGLTEEHGH